MKTIGIIPRIKLISLWNNVKRNGLNWTKSPSKNSYIERIKAYGKKSKFYTLLKPQIVLIMDPGKYDVKIYTLKKINCMSWSVSCIRYIFAVNIVTKAIIMRNQAIELKNWLKNKRIFWVLLSRKSVL